MDYSQLELVLNVLKTIFLSSRTFQTVINIHMFHIYFCYFWFAHVNGKSTGKQRSSGTFDLSAADDIWKM